MSSPSWDSLSVRLSREIGDKVASASSDGNTVSSAQRDIYLNSACRQWLKTKYDQKDWNALKQYKKQDTGHSLGSGGTYDTSSLSPLLAWTENLQVSDGSHYYNATPLPPEMTNVNQSTLVRGNTFFTASATVPYYTFLGLTLYVFPSATFGSQSFVLDYIAQHASLSAGGSTDILIENTYWSEIIKLAVDEARADGLMQSGTAPTGNFRQLAEQQMNQGVSSY